MSRLLNLILTALIAFPLSLTSREKVLGLEGKVQNPRKILEPVNRPKKQQGGKEHIIVRNPEYENVRFPEYKYRFPGMFSVFNTVVGCLDLYEQETYAGITVDFLHKGSYYDLSRGPNWWTYYCEPIDLGSRLSHTFREFNYQECHERATHTEFRLSKERVHELINRYIRFKPFILNAVDEFCEEFFYVHPVIGIHYRGTDKAVEAPVVSYDSVISIVSKHIEDEQLFDYSIFVATDEYAFLEALTDAFPGKVVYTNAERSKNGAPLHYSSTNLYQQGLETVIDCLLLSRADVLFRTSSNLSLWSTYLNPELPVIELTKRHAE